MHVALAQERSLRWSSWGVNCFSGGQSTCLDAESCGGSRQGRFRMNAANTTPSACFHSVSAKLARSRWRLSFYLFLCTRKQEKQDDSSLPDCVCAQSLTAPVVGKNCDYVCAVVRQHACNHLSAGMDAVKDHKANTSLTGLYLYRNNVGDAGAAALADALQATVLACGSKSFQACASCFPRCRLVEWFQQLASSSS